MVGDQFAALWRRHFIDNVIRGWGASNFNGGTVRPSGIAGETI
ncbi:MAG: hypothetical protein ACLQNE_10150 [Thermoguttaceae bacterium]